MTLQPIAFAFYGSSLTTGRLSADWVPTLKRRLEQEPEAKGRVIVYNMGKGSQTSDWGVANAPEVSHLKPTHILFEGFAINDCAIGPVSLAQAATNFDLMVTEWRTNIPGVYLTHQTMSPASVADANRTNLQTYYNQELAQAVSHSIPSLDHTGAWPAIDDSNTAGAVGQTYAPPTGFSVWGGSFNPADKSVDVTLSGGNHVATSAGGFRAARGSQAHNSGKWYFEAIPSVVVATGSGIGIGTSAMNLSSYVGLGATSIGYFQNGEVLTGGASAATYSAFNAGDVIMVAADFDNLKIWFGKNGVWGAGIPSTNAGGITIPAGDYYPAWSGADTEKVGEHFGATRWGGDQLHPIWPGVFETYSYPSILAWAKARMAAHWP